MNLQGQEELPQYFSSGYDHNQDNEVHPLELIWKCRVNFPPCNPLIFRVWKGKTSHNFIVPLSNWLGTTGLLWLSDGICWTFNPTSPKTWKLCLQCRHLIPLASALGWWMDVPISNITCCLNASVWLSSRCPARHCMCFPAKKTTCGRSTWVAGFWEVQTNLQRIGEKSSPLSSGRMAKSHFNLHSVLLISWWGCTVKIQSKPVPNNSGLTLTQTVLFSNRTASDKATA